LLGWQLLYTSNFVSHYISRYLHLPGSQ